MKKKITLALALALALNAISLAGCSVHRNYYSVDRWHHWGWHGRGW